MPTPPPAASARGRHGLLATSSQLLVLLAAAGASAQADPAEVVIGERLFLETRFAEYFARRATDINAPLAVGDPVVATTRTTGADPRDRPRTRWNRQLRGLASCPRLADRNADPNAWLPAGPLHPNAREPFRAATDAGDPRRSDLGVWNIVANPDQPAIQA